MTQTFTKTAIAAGILASAALGTGIAQAAAVQPATGNGDLILFIQDTVTHVTYARDTGIAINTLFSSSSAVANAPSQGTVAMINGLATQSIAADANLTAFLAASGTDALQWAVEAGGWTATTGAGRKPIGAARYLTTSSAPANITVVAQTAAAGGMTAFNGDVTNLNSFGNLGATNSTNEIGPFTAANPQGDGIWGTANGSITSQSWYGANIPTSGNPVNTTALTLFGITGNGTGTGSGSGFALAYNVGSVKLDGAGNLTFTGNGASAVPLPAAIWLLGSGLLGLAGVGRRRSVKA
jgi:hypothetical protein